MSVKNKPVLVIILLVESQRKTGLCTPPHTTPASGTSEMFENSWLLYCIKIWISDRQYHTEFRNC